MDTFLLKIVTPDGSVFDGEAQKLFCRTITGDVGILPRHCDYCTALGMGDAHVIAEGKTRHAACMGGMLSVQSGEARLIATTWEWADEIDQERAARSAERANVILSKNDADASEIELAKARLKRALVRSSVAKK